jgi:hypothetical protein
MAEKPATEKPVHVVVAEDVLAKVKKSVREKLTLTPKSSYTAISDEHGWIMRVTPKVLEASKKRLTEEDLDKSGLHGGNKPMHRPHHLAGEVAVAAMEPGEARVAAEAELQGGGLEEVAAALELGAKPPKKEPAAEAAPKDEGK